MSAKAQVNDETADEWVTLDQFDYEKPVRAKLGECEGCGAVGVRGLNDPNHAYHHPDHASVVLRMLTETWRSGGKVLVCRDC